MPKLSPATTLAVVVQSDHLFLEDGAPSAMLGGPTLVSTTSVAF